MESELTQRRGRTASGGALEQPPRVRRIPPLHEPRELHPRNALAGAAQRRHRRARRRDRRDALIRLAEPRDDKARARRRPVFKREARDVRIVGYEYETACRSKPCITG